MINITSFLQPLSPEQLPDAFFWVRHFMQIKEYATSYVTSGFAQSGSACVLADGSRIYGREVLVWEYDWVCLRMVVVSSCAYTVTSPEALFRQHDWMTQY